MTTLQAIRILDAKAGELEAAILDGRAAPNDLAADIALVAGFLAEFIERFDSRLVILEAHMENLIERTYELEGGDDG